MPISAKRTALSIRVLGALALILAWSPPAWMAAAADSTPATLAPVVPLPAVADVAGPRRDGRLVLAAGRQLYLLDRAAARLEPYAGPGGLLAGAGDEPYLAVSAGGRVTASGCRFPVDETYVLAQGPRDILAVDPTGSASRFAHIDGVDSLGGITFDVAGRFGNRLLVIAPAHGRTVVLAIDCRGVVTHITDIAPAMEGGIVVAPPDFGAFGGDLIAPDELSGVIRAVRPDGSTDLVAASGLPHGGDIGVESLGFVPKGFAAGGTAYLADRSTPGNPHPGTGQLLALDAAHLVGVQEGDLLAATEGGAVTVAVRCGSSPCRVDRVAMGSPVAHAEGHILLLADQPVASTSPLPEAPNLGNAGQTQATLVRLGVAAVALLLLGLAGWYRLRRRAR